jgi:hypothetical protein
MGWKKKASIAVASIVAFLVGGVLVAACAASRPRPEAGIPDDTAEELVDQMHEALGGEAAWRATRALRLKMGSAGPHILWDRERAFAEVRFDDGRRVLLRTQEKTGLAYKGGALMEGRAAEDALADAYARFVNDTFWLAAYFMTRAPGTTRSTVVMAGKPGLLVEYASGGKTPGDAYAWQLGADYRPAAWRIWAGAMPLKGVRVELTDWRRMDTGIWLAAGREGPFGLGFTFEPMGAAATLAQLTGGEDPFAALEPEPAPASQPAP